MNKEYIWLLSILYACLGIKESGSRLPILLDKKTWDKVVDCFGGKTLYIPSRYEFDAFLSAFLLWEDVYVNGLSFDEASHKLGHRDNFRYIVKLYKRIEEEVDVETFRNMLGE